MVLKVKRLQVGRKENKVLHSIRSSHVTAASFQKKYCYTFIISQTTEKIDRFTEVQSEPDFVGLARCLPQRKISEMSPDTLQIGARLARGTLAYNQGGLACKEGQVSMADRKRKNV